MITLSLLCIFLIAFSNCTIVVCLKGKQIVPAAVWVSHVAEFETIGPVFTQSAAGCVCNLMM